MTTGSGSPTLSGYPTLTPAAAASRPGARRDFVAQLAQRQAQASTRLCVGLDPDLERIPVRRRDPVETIHDFCIAICEATAEAACAFKPQIAYFAAHRAEAALESVIEQIHRRFPQVPVILDAKRGDIGSTAAQYAREAFQRYDADAVTLSPYMGRDSIEPYFDYPGRGLFLLCRTSNAGGADLQALPVDAAGTPLYLHLARTAASRWNAAGNLGLVVGATFPDELRAIRKDAPELPLLIPGIGAQGGDIVATLAATMPFGGGPIIINSSRAILYAGTGENHAQAAHQAALETRDAITAAIQAVAVHHTLNQTSPRHG